MSVQAEILSILAGGQRFALACASMQGPQRFVSFLDMLKLDTRNIFSALAFLGGTIGEFNMYISASTGRISTLTNTLETRAQIMHALQNSGSFANLHGMKTTQAVAKDAFNLCLELLVLDTEVCGERLHTFCG